MTENKYLSPMARAAAYGGVSVESVRQFGRVRELRPDLADQVAAGTLSMNAAYREAVGDDSAALYLKIPAWVDDVLRAQAAELGMSRAAWARILLFDALAEDNQERTHP